MRRAVVTGGAGFFGGVLLRRLLEDGWKCLSIDRLPVERAHPNLQVAQADIRDRTAVDAAFGSAGNSPVDAVFHCAAVLAHGRAARNDLWTSNVDGTRTLLEACTSGPNPRASAFTFVSSNCLWGRAVGHPVREDQPPDPIELYGRSKVEAERVVLSYADRLPCTIVRTPTIIDEGRLGLLTILFDFIRENRRVWVVGQGENRYQFLYAPDLADACIRAVESARSGTFNVGSDKVETLRETFEEVIRSVGSRSRVGMLPKSATLLAMRLAHAAGLSPLGPYHYRMIAESFEFDTSHARESLGWRPTLTGGGMLAKACHYYLDHYAEIHARRFVSPHRKAAHLGAIRLLKWLS